MAKNWTTRFTRLDHSILKSPAYRSLTPNARSLLVEMAMMENGKNNGELFLSARDAAARMGVADPHTACAALDELEEAGFIACTVEAHFAVKAGVGSRARSWRLTWQSVPSISKAPTNEYVGRQTFGDARTRKRMEAGCRALKRHEGEIGTGQETTLKKKMAVRDFHTLNAERVRKNHTTEATESPKAKESVGNNHTRFSENAENPPKSVVRNNHTHTAYQLGAASREPASPRPHKGQGANDGGTTDCCERCSEPFKSDGRGWATKRFCSEACRKAAERARAYQRRKHGDDAASIGAVLSNAFPQLVARAAR